MAGLENTGSETYAQQAAENAKLPGTPHQKAAPYMAALLANQDIATKTQDFFQAEAYAKVANVSYDIHNRLQGRVDELTAMSSEKAASSSQFKQIEQQLVRAEQTAEKDLPAFKKAATRYYDASDSNQQAGAALKEAIQAELGKLGVTNPCTQNDVMDGYLETVKQLNLEKNGVRMSGGEVQPPAIQSTKPSIFKGAFSNVG